MNPSVRLLFHHFFASLAFRSIPRPQILLTTKATKSKPNKHEVKSKTIRKTLYPEWNDEISMWFNVAEPEELVGAHLILKFMDYDWGIHNADDLIGTVILSIADMVKEQEQFGTFSFKKPIIR